LPGLDCDDDLALLALLAEAAEHPDMFSVAGVSVCGGNAPLAHTWKNTMALWKHIDFDAIASRTDSLHDIIGPKRGHGWRSMQVSRWWLSLFHTLAQDMPNSEDAVDAIVDHVTKTAAENRKTAGDGSDLTLLTLGPPTNVARAIEKIELQNHGNSEVTKAIHHVYMMGGELTGQRLDLNFVSDRAAARTIVDNQHFPKTLITIQLCAQVIIDAHFVDNFERQCCQSSSGNAGKRDAAACAILPKMRQQIELMPRYINPSVSKRLPVSERWTPSSKIMKGFVPWDLVAVLVITQPELFDHYEYHRVAFPRCEKGEPCDKTMAVLEHLGTSREGNKNHSGIVRVTHTVVNETLVLEKMHNLLCSIPAATDHHPKLMLGFVGQVFGMALATCLLLLLLCYHRRRG
jgi:inosine-uridine nucleoside N-ribohydrolase